MHNLFVALFCIQTNILLMYFCFLYVYFLIPNCVGELNICFNFSNSLRAKLDDATVFALLYAACPQKMYLHRFDRVELEPCQCTV